MLRPMPVGSNHVFVAIAAHPRPPNLKDPLRTRFPCLLSTSRYRNFDFIERLQNVKLGTPYSLGHALPERQTRLRRCNHAPQTATTSVSSGANLSLPRYRACGYDTSVSE